MGILQNIESIPSTSDVWKFIKSHAVSVKQRATGLVSASTSDNVHVGTILDFTTYLADVRLKLAVAVGIANLNDVVRNDMNDNAIDAVAYVTSLITAIDSLLVWVSANMPASGQYNLIVTILPTGRYQWRSFTPAQLVNFRVELAALATAV